MKIETILDDCLRAYRAITESNSRKEYEKLSHQYRDLRARILQMDAEKDAEIERYKSLADALANPEREAWD